MNNKDKKLQLELKKNLAELETAVEGLKLSFEKCSGIGVKSEYTFEEQESFDSLTTKFARCSDIYTQKIWKTVFILLRENPGSFIDKANLAEKLGIIPSADKFLEIRDSRNEIVHEYKLQELKIIYEVALIMYPELINAIDQTKLFIHNHKLV